MLRPTLPDAMVALWMVLVKAGREAVDIAGVIEEGAQREKSRSILSTLHDKIYSGSSPLNYCCMPWATISWE